MNSTLEHCSAWQRLAVLSHPPGGWQMSRHFREDADRYRSFTLEAAGIHADTSRQCVDREVRNALLALARERELAAAISALAAGDPVNVTERRPARHMALRAPGAAVAATGEPAVDAALQGMRELTAALASGALKGYSGQPLRAVVNLGIGGSDLGPRLVCSALPAPAGEASAHFAANLDGADLAATLQPLNPREVLFIVTSKSFGTEETLLNMARARDWLRASGCPEAALAQHFVAVTARPERARQANGLTPGRILPFADWVGGRFSLWSAAGLIIPLTRGWATFAALLEGAAAMDRHYCEAPLPANLPAWLALLDIWNVNHLGSRSIAVLPYAHNLRLLPDYLQQLAMESNGKRVGVDGRALAHHTGPVFWGDAGTVGQHSFHQLLHQGTDPIPVEFVLPLAGAPGHERMVAHCLSQALALMAGEDEQAVRTRLAAEGLPAAEVERLAPHLVVPGSRPCTLLTLPRPDAFHIGALLALYEHRIHASSVIWGINAFDQWGVELGKRISARLRPALLGDGIPDELDGATRATIERYRHANGSSVRDDKELP